MQRHAAAPRITLEALNTAVAGGAVTLIQRFGSAANLNIHLHCLVLNSVYRRGTDGAPEFVDASAPTDEAPQTVLLRPLQAAACTCRIACGPRAGQKVLTLLVRPGPTRPAYSASVAMRKSGSSGLAAT